MISQQLLWTCLLLLAKSCSAFAPIALRRAVAFVPSTSTAEKQRVRKSTELCMARKGGGGNRNNRGRRGRRGPVVEDRPVMNTEIMAPELRVMAASSTGGKDEALGILSRDEALAKAKEMGDLDLILINEKSDPPVCKIVDYSKFRYMKEKKAKELKKNSKATEIKEVKMSYKIDVHDYEVRRKNASKFLKQGNRVKCTVMFRGREVQHDKLGFELLDKLALDLEDIAMKEGRPKREGRSLARILSPKPEVMRAVSEGKRADEKAKKKKKEEAFRKKQEEANANVQVEEESSVAATAIADLEEADNVDDLLNALSIDSDDDDDDGDDDDDDDDDDVGSSLDALLGSDDLTDDLFS